MKRLPALAFVAAAATFVVAAPLAPRLILKARHCLRCGSIKILIEF